jgi:ATP synthase protein I
LFQARSPAKGLGVMLSIQSRPIRTVLWWQTVAAVACAALGGWLAGLHGALSAGLGGGIGIVGGLAFAWLASRSRTDSPDRLVFSALRAEGLKVTLFILLLWLVLATYRQVVVAGLIGSFIVSTLIFTLAVFVRDA